MKKMLISTPDYNINFGNVCVRR